MEPRIGPHNYSHLIPRRNKSKSSGAKTVFATNGAGKTGHTHTKKVILDTELTTITKVNSK